MEKDTQFRKNFIWNTLGTGLNAFNSLFFMIIATRVNGIEQAGVFTIAFSTACILYAIGLYAGRVYQVTELDEKISDKDFIINRIITCFSMIVFLILFCIFRKYNLEKTVIFLLLTIYKALEAFSDTIYGILQKHDKLDIVGKSLFIKSLLSILLFLIIDLLIGNIIVAIISMIIICVIINITYDFRKAYKYVDFKQKINWENVINILKKGFFVFAISFLGMYVVNAPKYSIDSYLTSDFQTIFGIIVMPATIMSLVAQFLIHPYLNQIVELYKTKNLKGLEKLILKILGIIGCFGVLATILGYLLGTQILGLIYGIDLSMYKIGLSIIIISATLYTIGTVCSSILTTVRETFSQFVIYVGVSIFAYIISTILTKYIGINGSIIAYFFIMVSQALSYFIYTKIKLKKIFVEDKK